MSKDKSEFICSGCELNCVLIINHSVEPEPDTCPFAIKTPRWTPTIYEDEKSCKTCVHNEVCMIYYDAKYKWFNDLRWALEDKIRQYPGTPNKAVKESLTNKLIDAVSSVLAAACRHYK